jgi:alanine-glyoxylate transaminase/serine-glyoxylate transaminase/serine-pyruvate transaminase
MPAEFIDTPVRTLLGPGPSDVYPEVLKALSRPTIGHLDPRFVELMDQTKELLRYAFQTRNELTMPVSAPGSAGMETCFVNLIEPGDKAVVCVNGVFGGRMRDIVQRIGGTAVVVEDKWGSPVDPQKVEDALKANQDAKYVAFVHAETSTGAQSDAKALVDLAHRYNCLAIVDAVTSLGGTPLKVDEWQIDAVYSGSQKCLSCIPGLSPISFNERALSVVKNRKSKPVSWFLDLNLVTQYWGGNAKRSYHHTAPVNCIYALNQSLRILKNEGLENSWKRHYQNHLKLKEALGQFGLEFVVDEKHRLPQLNAVRVPSGVDEAAVRRRLLDDYNIEIGAGLGEMAGKIWRIGLMGYSSNPQNIEKLTSALRKLLVVKPGEPVAKG